MIPNQESKISRFKLKEDMEKVREKVLGLGSLWNQRLPDRPFFTLGPSAYMDIAIKDKTDYNNNLIVTNNVLAHCFGSLYREVSAVLEKELGKPNYYDANYALPGFHVFFAHPAFVTSGGLWHMDMGHVQLELPGINPISFTVTVRLPKDGGGLQYKKDDKEKYLPYEVGGMIMHSGCTMHKIAPLKAFHEDDERITMQGHGVDIDGEYLLFW